MNRVFLFLIVSVIFLTCNPAKEEKKQIPTTKVDTVSVDPFAPINEKIKQNPNDALLYYDRAKYHFDNKHFQESLNDIERALKLDSSNCDFYLLKADISLIKHHSRDVIEALNKCISFNSENVEAYLKRAEIYMLLQKYQQAIDNINFALKADVYNARAYFMKGMVYKFTSDTSRAVSNFQTAVEQDNEYYDAYIQLGLLFAAKHNPLAKDYYDNAIRIRPNSLGAIYNKCIFLQEHGEAEKALEGYKLILQINPLNINAHYNIGYVNLVYFKNFETAFEKFSEVIELQPDHYGAYTNRGVCYEMTGNSEKAVADFRKALELKPDFTEAAKGLGRILD
ncbi:MAG: hypothetical protein COA57_04365 [Flavobacteriales bacterium]|nr:MAG: hypothetical protein COA57_04365 [Flavobacteriales bacterium]